MKRSFFVVTISLLLASCASIVPQKDKGQIDMTPATISQLGDAKYWIVVRPITYVEHRTGKTIVVPKGFVTDLASVPRKLWSLLSPIDSYMTAAILHDYLYWDQRCGQDEADIILNVAMKSYGVSSDKRHAIFDGVHFAGKQSYENNAQLKQKGESRFLSDEYVERLLKQYINHTITWEQVKKDAAEKQGLIPDTSNEHIKEACVAASNMD